MTLSVTFIYSKSRCSHSSPFAAMAVTTDDPFLRISVVDLTCLELPVVRDPVLLWAVCAVSDLSTEADPWINTITVISK